MYVQHYTPRRPSSGRDVIQAPAPDIGGYFSVKRAEIASIYRAVCAGENVSVPAVLRVATGSPMRICFQS